jgi:hypothetical protein
VSDLRALLDAGLVDIGTARREAAGGHAQVFCAVREVVHANGASWRSPTPNASASTAWEAMGTQLRTPLLPRPLVGHTSAIAAADDACFKVCERQALIG